MNQSETEWVTVAVLGKTRGNRGEVTAVPFSSKLDRFERLESVYLFGSGEQLEVEFTWFHQGTLVFKFKGIDDISAAERLSGAEVRVPKAQRAPLDPGEYFQSDLIGCRVVDRLTGRDYGHVRNWQDGGGSGLLELDGGLLIPFARSICVEIDPEAKHIAVELPEGLKDLNQP